MDTLTTVRYIDANKLMSDLCLRSCHNREHRCDNDSAANEDLAIVEMIKKMPVLDVVPVVRCRDCMWKQDRYAGCMYCGYWGLHIDPAGFCSMGKTRDGGAEE